MALQIITVVLFSVFFSEALTLMCYNCTTVPPATTCTATDTCPADSQCSSVTTYYGSNSPVSVKKCASSPACVTSSISLGWAGMSSQCCSSDLCNPDTASDSVKNLTCFTCNGANCTTTQKCKGVENRCITAKVNVNKTVLKGCASEHFCKNGTELWTLISMLNIEWISLVSSVSCCEANLCNNAQSMTLGHVLLFVPILPLLFYI